MNQQVELNLVNEITELHAKLGHTRPEAWIKYVNPDALISNNPDIQRFLINRCFRMIIGAVTTEDTMDVRYCLLDNGSYSEWKHLFETMIVPVTVRLNLP